MSFFHYQLVRLHTSCYIVEKIIHFPFDLFGGPDNIFWSQVIFNFFDTCILLITAMATDQADGLHTLKHFKGWLLQQCKPEYKGALVAYLHVYEFDEATHEILERAKFHRNKRVAHHTNIFVREFNEKALKNNGLNFSELVVLRDKLTTLFQALAFSSHYGMLDVSYRESTSDIERVLDSIAEKSSRLKMPEQRPDEWAGYCRRLSKEKWLSLITIEESLDWRRFKLPQIAPR